MTATDRMTAADRMTRADGAPAPDRGRRCASVMAAA